MKTIVRIGQVFDSRERVQQAQLGAFGTAMLADAFGRRRQDFPEAALIVEKDHSGQPVYVILSGNPPELLAGDRKVHAVFSPVDSQEPIASFREQSEAETWVQSQPRYVADGYDIRLIDSTDRIAIRPCVGLVIKRGNTDDVLYCRIKRNKQWTIPEGVLSIGETVDSAGRRTAREQLGVEIGATMIPGRVPYVNAFIEDVGHFLTLLLVTTYTGADEPKLQTDLYDAWQWAPAATPPEPKFVTVAAVQKVLAITPPPESTVTATPVARLALKKKPRSVPGKKRRR